MRQQDLADLSGVKKQAIYRIEKGLVPNLGQQRLGRITAALGTTIRDLLLEAEEAKEVVAYRITPEAVIPVVAEERRPVYAGKRLPPKAYELIFTYVEKLEGAGFDPTEVDEAEKFLFDAAYNKINAREPGEKNEDDIVLDIKAAWQFVRDVATRGGKKL